MKKVIALVAALVLASGVAGFFGFSEKPDFIAPVVKLTDRNGHGSGVFIGPVTILTVAHVAENLEKNGKAIGPDGTLYTVVDVKLHEDKDFAIVTVDRPYNGWMPRVSCAHQERGTELINVGNPTDVEFVYSRLFPTGGKLDKGQDQMGVEIYQGLAIPGQSGSPVYTKDGELVGVVTITVTLYQPLQGPNKTPYGVYGQSGMGGYVALENVCDFIPLTML